MEPRAARGGGEAASGAPHADEPGSAARAAAEERAHLVGMGESDRRMGPWRGYGGEEMPLAGYAVLLGAWTAIFGGLAAGLARRRALPRTRAGDVVLLGIATHKLTRIVTKDWVTIPLRAPFTEYVGSRGSGEVNERARGRGLRRAVGDLLTCNYCTGPWAAGALLAGMAAAPRLTRSAAALLSAVTVSDFLHEVFENLRERRALESAAQEATRARAERVRRSVPGEATEARAH